MWRITGTVELYSAQYVCASCPTGSNIELTSSSAATLAIVSIRLRDGSLELPKKLVMSQRQFAPLRDTSFICKPMHKIYGILNIIDVSHLYSPLYAVSSRSIHSHSHILTFLYLTHRALRCIGGEEVCGTCNIPEMGLSFRDAVSD